MAWDGILGVITAVLYLHIELFHDSSAQNFEDIEYFFDIFLVRPFKQHIRFCTYQHIHPHQHSVVIILLMHTAIMWDIIIYFNTFFFLTIQDTSFDGIEEIFFYNFRSFDEGAWSLQQFKHKGLKNNHSQCQ